MRWTGHVARIREREAYTGFWWGNLKEKDHMGDPGLDGMIILTFRNPASYIKDGHTATFNTPHFLYFFNKCTY
jgi:hypothetical protein